MIIVDRLIIGGVRFVLGKVIAAVDEELNDDSSLRNQLLEAQMRFELGEIDADELAEVERNVMTRLRELSEERGGGAPMSMAAGDYEVTGVDAEAELGHRDGDR